MVVLTSEWNPPPVILLAPKLSMRSPTEPSIKLAIISNTIYFDTIASKNTHVIICLQNHGSKGQSIA